MLLPALLLAGAMPAPITPADLLGVTDLSGLSISPDGHWLVFRAERASTASNRVETQWLAVSTTGKSKPRLIAEGGAALWTGAGVVEPEQPVWLPDSRTFAFRAVIDGEVQAWVADVETGATKRAASFDGGVLAIGEDHGTLTFTIGPGRDAVRAAEQAIRDEGARVDGSVDLAVGVVGGVAAPFGTKSVRLTGNWFDRRDLLADRPVRYFRLAATGDVQPAGDGPRPPGFPVADSTVRDQICKTVDCNSVRIDATVHLPGRDDWLVTTADHGLRQTLNLWDGARLKPAYRSPGLASGSRVQYQPCAVISAVAFCVVASADQPPRLARIDLATGKPDILFDPNAELRTRTTGRVTAVRWSDPAGHDFEGQLYLPQTKQPAAGYPLVIQYYWCDGFVRGGQGEELPFLALADNGIAGLCVNRSFASVRHPGGPEDFVIAQSGIEAIIDRLSHAGEIDAGRVGMQGLSLGSQITMWVASHSKRLRAISISSGQFEPSSYWYYAAPKHDFESVVTDVYHLGDPAKAGQAWRDAAPALKPEVPMPPTLMQLPESEARWSMELFRQLERKTTVEMYVFPDAAHVKSLPRQLLAASSRNLDWFKRWLDPK